jgi:hypothetical protein
MEIGCNIMFDSSLRNMPGLPDEPKHQTKNADDTMMGLSDTAWLELQLLLLRLSKALFGLVSNPQNRLADDAAFGTVKFESWH